MIIINFINLFPNSKKYCSENFQLELVNTPVTFSNKLYYALMQFSINIACILGSINCRRLQWNKKEALTQSKLQGQQ